MYTHETNCNWEYAVEMFYGPVPILDPKDITYWFSHQQGLMATNIKEIVIYLKTFADYQLFRLLASDELMYHTYKHNHKTLQWEKI